ncbi:hypothetical protein MF672_039085 [Actinomadura sp. ATCC 31491]|uniref:Transposase n=1 Tax=Actinomadura luzonensis TaxID=2805427 RepID=A0ABT0G5A1_9ACTN|nr:hypothetical protein [Actinomadura luzonensis]MCK2219760.1 hypothetical protein [Actinomadura luzonensis]
MAVDLIACQVVSVPSWNDGEPVRIQAAHVHAGKVAVRWQDARCCGAIHADWVEQGMHVDLISGGCLRRPAPQPVLAAVPEGGSR